MEQDTVIKVEGLYKKFTRSLKRSLFYGSIDVAKSMLGIKYDPGVMRKGEFWSLENVNFELKRGETFGLIGANGSGKSTLLRMINGIFPPDRGRIEVKGRIGALIAVGAGFHPHMTGRENILLNGTVLGMTREEIAREMDNIIAFADIGDFLDAPVSTYSSGMYVRLGFAIAIHCHPEIMLVDEILAVGDAKFQRKCLDKIKEMRERGTTFILVSHNMQNIEAMCDRALLLDHGKQVMLGTPREIIPIYELLLETGKTTEQLISKTIQPGESESLDLVFKYSDFGTDEIIVNKVTLLDENNQPMKNINSEEPLTVEVEVDSGVEVKQGIIVSMFFYVNNRERVKENVSSLGMYERIDIPKGKSTIRLTYPQAQLTTGEYSLTINIFDETFTNPYTQGFYGYFIAKKGVPTMLRVGDGTPYVWTKPEIAVKAAN
jgi:lipopolysaccharide transport system ATP-binding protein